MTFCALRWKFMLGVCCLGLAAGAMPASAQEGQPERELTPQEVEKRRQELTNVDHAAQYLANAPEAFKPQVSKAIGSLKRFDPLQTVPARLKELPAGSVGTNGVPDEQHSQAIAQDLGDQRYNEAKLSVYGSLTSQGVDPAYAEPIAALLATEAKGNAEDVAYKWLTGKDASPYDSVDSLLDPSNPPARVVVPPNEPNAARTQAYLDVVPTTYQPAVLPVARNIPAASIPQPPEGANAAARMNFAHSQGVKRYIQVQQNVRDQLDQLAGTGNTRLQDPNVRQAISQLMGAVARDRLVLAITQGQ